MKNELGAFPPWFPANENTGNKLITGVREQGVFHFEVWETTFPDRDFMFGEQSGKRRGWVVENLDTPRPLLPAS
jgi:hypothetical protein